MMIMCQRSFVNGNKCTLLWGLGMREAVRMWGQGVDGDSFTSAPFYCDPKTALNIKTLENKTKACSPEISRKKEIPTLCPCGHGRAHSVTSSGYSV